MSSYPWDVSRLVVVRENGRFVAAVDPKTRKTHLPQQFKMTPDARGYSLQPVPRDEWIDDPFVIDVDALNGVGSFR